MKATITKTTMGERIEIERLRLLEFTKNKPDIREHHEDIYGKNLMNSSRDALVNIIKEEYLIDFLYDYKCWICGKNFEIDDKIVIFHFENEDWEYAEDSYFILNVCIMYRILGNDYYGKINRYAN